MSMTEKEKIDAVLMKLELEINTMTSFLIRDDFDLSAAKQVYAQASFLYRVLSPIKVDAGASYRQLKFIRELMDIFVGGITSISSDPKYQGDYDGAADYYKSIGGDFGDTMHRLNEERGTA